jgi:hypothetical protein
MGGAQGRRGVTMSGLVNSRVLWSGNGTEIYPNPNPAPASCAPITARTVTEAPEHALGSQGQEGDEALLLQASSRHHASSPRISRFRVTKRNPDPTP